MNKDLKIFLQILGIFTVAISVLIIFEFKVAERKPLFYIDPLTQATPVVTPTLEPEDVKSVNGEWVNQLKVTRADFKKIEPAFTLFSASGPEKVQLLNLASEVVHEWNNIDVDRVRLLPNCNIIALHGSKNKLMEEPWSKLRNAISEYDWSGKLIWRYTAEGLLHHDLQRLDNGNTLVLLRAPLPEEKKALIKDPLRRSFNIQGDSVLEISPKGEIVWRWNAWDHFDVNFCGKAGCEIPDASKQEKIDREDLEDWIHINTLSVIPENKWYDSGDQRFKPGNLLIMPRNFWTAYIIDKATGKLVWEYSGDYKGGMIRSHEPFMIAKGLPGEGNILIFDNGDRQRNASYVLEVEPVNKKLVWVYDVGDKFVSRARGSIQRLSNGNTLVSDDRGARVFEIGADRKKVWELQSTLPVVRVQKYRQDFCPQLASLKLQ